MPLSIKAKKEKDENLEHIGDLLCQIKNGTTSARTFMRPMLIEPSMYLTIYTQAGEDPCHKRGYVVELDSRTHKPISARYFVSEGPNTYTEVDLTLGQFNDLVDYYKINEMDIWYMFHKKVG